MSAVRISVVSVSVALLLTTACLSVREARESGALSARERSKADALAHFSRGLLAEWQGPASVAGTALTEYQAGAVSDPDSADLVCKEAAALMSLGRYDEALSVLQKAAEKLPDSAMVNFGLGRVFGVLTRFPESAEAFLRAAELSHDSAPDMMNCLLMAAASFDNAGGIRGLVNTLELIVGCPDDTLANFIPQDDPESETTPRMIAIGTASEFLVKYASAGRNADAGMLLAFCAANARDATSMPSCKLRLSPAANPACSARIFLATRMLTMLSAGRAKACSTLFMPRPWRAV